MEDTIKIPSLKHTPCPSCGKTGGLEHENWYEATKLDLEPLYIVCDFCKWNHDADCIKHAYSAYGDEIPCKIEIDNVLC